MIDREVKRQNNKHDKLLQRQVSTKVFIAILSVM